MKKIFFISFILLFISIKSQDVRKFIPKDAALIVTIDGDNLLELNYVSELNKNHIVKDFLFSINSKINRSTQTIDSLGIDIYSKSCFYINTNDSISYYTSVFPLNNPDLIDLIFKDSIDDKASYRKVKLEPKVFLAWDNEKLILISADYKESYFENYVFEEEEDHSESLYQLLSYLKREEYSSIDIYDIDILLTYPVPIWFLEELEALFESKQMEGEEMTMTFYDNLENLKVEKEKAREIGNEIAVEELEDEIEHLNNTYSSKRDEIESSSSILAEYMGEAYTNSTYGHDYSSNKNDLANIWTENIINELMKEKSESILDNKKYVEQYDESTNLNVFSESLGDLILNMSDYANELGNIYRVYEEFNLNVYLDENIKVKYKLSISDEYAEKINSMAKQRINKKFYKYLNEDEFIGYISYNINMENILIEYPNLIPDSFTTTYHLGIDKEKFSLGMELFSLLLDEKAVSEVIKGDMLYVFTGMQEREVTYIDYQVDDDYNYTEVEKTKMEMMPDFLFMASSKKIQLTDRFIEFLLKDKLIEEAYTGIYKTTHLERDLPVQIYFTFHNGLFICGTSYDYVLSVKNDTFKKKLSSKHKKLLKKNNNAIYFNNENMAKQMGDFKESSENSEKVEPFQYFIENVNDCSIYSRMNGSNAESEIIIDVNPDKVDATLFLINIFR